MDGWHIGAMAEHLEAVNDGEITRLVINIPPRRMKSVAVSVMWPAFTWGRPRLGPTCGPNTRFITLSYGLSLSLRDLSKFDRL